MALLRGLNDGLFDPSSRRNRLELWGGGGGGGLEMGWSTVTGHG